MLVYLPPKGSKFYVSVSEATEKLRFVMTNFEKMRVSNCSGELHTNISGDFNFPSVNWDCMKSSRSDEQILIDFLAQDFLMDQIIRNPTHKHGNILDLAFVSQVEAWDYELLSSKLSDRTPVLLTYSAKYIPCNNFLSEYSLSSFDETAFLQSLNIDSRLPNSPINGNSNQCFSSLWLFNFQNALCSSLALKRKKRRSLPFYSSLTVHYLKKLETARRRKAGDLAIRKLENEVSQFIERDKASFLSSAKFFSTNDAFKLLKHLSCRSSVPNNVYWKDTEAETVLDEANLFNYFFKSVYSELSNGSVDFGQETTSDIFLSEICFDSLQLCEFLRDIPTGTIAAFDGIPPFIYRSCSELLAACVHSLFSFILRRTCWPLFWKCAHVTPLHKKGLKSDIENYRPISILSRLSLVFDRIIFNYLYSKIRHKFNSNQHGFQQGLSTITQLVLFIDELYAKFDNNWEQIVLYLDFSKAFDTVNHATLISKLAYFGLDLEFRSVIRSHWGIERNEFVSMETFLTSYL